MAVGTLLEHADPNDAGSSASSVSENAKRTPDLVDVLYLLQNLDVAQRNILIAQRNLCEEQKTIREEYKVQMSTLRKFAEQTQERRLTREVAVPRREISSKISFAPPGDQDIVKDSEARDENVDGTDNAADANDLKENARGRSSDTSISSAGNKVSVRPSNSSSSEGSMQHRCSRHSGIRRALQAHTIGRIDSEPLSPFNAVGQLQRVKAIVKRFVLHDHLDQIMGPIILANVIIIGAEIEHGLRGAPQAWMEDAEQVFLLCYGLELALRLWAAGVWASLGNGWTRFDLMLVIVGALSEWLLQPILRIHLADLNSKRVFDQIMVLRVLRLLRLIRAVRLISMFQILWRLVRGLLNSYSTVLSTFFLLALAIYVFACIGVEVITKNQSIRRDPRLNTIVEAHYSSLTRTMLTLIRFISMEAVIDIYEPFILYNARFAFYFIPVGMVISIALMNLVTAVLVDSCIRESQEDAEIHDYRLRKRTRELLPELTELFGELDADGDGVVSLEDMIAGWQTPKSLQHRLGGMSTKELFGHLVMENSAVLYKDEFIEGILNLALVDNTPETTRQTYHVQKLQKHLTKVYNTVKQIEANQHFQRDLAKEQLAAVVAHFDDPPRNDFPQIPEVPEERRLIPHDTRDGKDAFAGSAMTPAFTVCRVRVSL